MDLIPHEELRPAHQANFAPMIDFLFLMLALFATLAISRSALFDAEIDLVSVAPHAKEQNRSQDDPKHQVHISIRSDGSYKWLTEFQEYPMESLSAIQDELARQYAASILPQDKQLTEVLLHIDEKTPWRPIADLIFSLRELGFTPLPVYTEKRPS